MCAGWYRRVYGFRVSGGKLRGLIAHDFYHLSDVGDSHYLRARGKCLRKLEKV